MNQGLAIHPRHNILVEFRYNYEKDVKTIKKDEPLAEQKIRLRLFKILPEEAFRDLPCNLQKSYTDLHKTEVNVRKAEVNLRKAEVDWRKTFSKWQETENNWQKSYDDWSTKKKDIFHKKWCGCNFWIDGKINFQIRKRVTMTNQLRKK